MSSLTRVGNGPASAEGNFDTMQQIAQIVSDLENKTGGAILALNSRQSAFELSCMVPDLKARLFKLEADYKICVERGNLASRSRQR